MKLNELLCYLPAFRVVVVTGPQRSGTTIAAKILAAELNHSLILEEEFREENPRKFFEAISKNGSFIVQAPALSSLVHLIKDQDIAVVFMHRETDEILESEQRIDWLGKHDLIEKSKYFMGDSELPISVLKKNIWDVYQKAALSERAFELEYDSLRCNSLWVEKEQRKNFHPRQTSIDR